MKEFSCAKFGNNCTEILDARTEERLTEMVSLHLREVHGMTSLPEATLARIKKCFTNEATTDAAYVVDRIFEKYNCDSDPECTWRYIDEAVTILTGQGSYHARELKAA